MTAIAHPPEYYAGLNWPVDKFPALKPQDFPDDRSFSVLRRSEEQLKADAKDDEDVRVFWKQCPTRDGKEISILFYEPIKRQRNESRLPLIVAIHGGGWVIGDYGVEDALCRKAVGQLGFMAASIHYRLSPEHKFPVPLDDCVDALKYLLESSAAYGFDASRIILASSSAGSSLAGGAFQVLQETLQNRVIGLLMNIPVTCDPLHFPAGEYTNLSWYEHANAPLLNAEAMTYCFDLYFPERRREPLISPLLSPVLAKFPPTAIVVTEFDPMRDQGIALKQALEKKGVPTRLKLLQGVPHGIHMMAGLPGAREAVSEMLDGVAWILQLGGNDTKQ